MNCGNTCAPYFRPFRCLATFQYVAEMYLCFRGSSSFRPIRPPHPLDAHVRRGTTNRGRCLIRRSKSSTSLTSALHSPNLEYRQYFGVSSPIISYRRPDWYLKRMANQAPGHHYVLARLKPA
ncbi:hypothetical protein NEOLEDRAFT_783771 [Neolentinus lepideus HHB14362 ss-1]|uniref:Uncharacterized protein n=1 Tax=Neolentinus lepideus HHB14362 ss-1 TaxID=1314782 RepID=A0A165UXJ8_9AGAM|nr:hypothetical protein NEOLEDRAFT_783771 [Neolentinus lepideus HHB14362 ss-1]